MAFQTFKKRTNLIKVRASVSANKGIKEEELLIAQPVTMFNYGLKFEHSFFWEATTINPFFMGGVLQETPPQLEARFYLVELTIHNRSGANDVYSWEFDNLSTMQVLESREDITINNKTTRSWHLLISPADLRIGETFIFVIYKGKLGTEQNEPIFGEVSLRLTTITEAQTIKDWLKTGVVE